MCYKLVERDNLKRNTLNPLKSISMECLLYYTNRTVLCVVLIVDETSRRGVGRYVRFPCRRRARTTPQTYGLDVNSLINGGVVIRDEGNSTKS